MSAQAQTYAAQGVRFLETALLQHPPPGVPAASVGPFFRRFGAALTTCMLLLVHFLFFFVAFCLWLCFIF